MKLYIDCIAHGSFPEKLYLRVVHFILWNAKSVAILKDGEVAESVGFLLWFYLDRNIRQLQSYCGGNIRSDKSGDILSG